MGITINDIDVYLNNKGIRHYSKDGQGIDVPISLPNGNDACICIVDEGGLKYRIDDEVIFSSTPSSIATPAIAMLMALLDNKPCYFA